VATLRVMSIARDCFVLNKGSHQVLNFTKCGGSGLWCCTPARRSTTKLMKFIKLCDAKSSIPVPRIGVWCTLGVVVCGPIGMQVDMGRPFQSGSFFSRFPLLSPGPTPPPSGHPPAGRNGTEWARSVASFVKLKGPTAIKYGELAAWRTRCLGRRAQRHWRHLDVNGMNLGQFQALCPDRGNWVRRLAPRGDKTVCGLFRSVGYKGDPALFSNWTCLFADIGLRTIPTGVLCKSVVKLRQTLLKEKSKLGFTPHPAVLVQTFLAENRGTQV
jgi:hypothetical protein